jgi:hypothetical protein
MPLLGTQWDSLSRIGRLRVLLQPSGCWMRRLRPESIQVSTAHFSNCECEHQDGVTCTCPSSSSVVIFFVFQGFDRSSVPKSRAVRPTGCGPRRSVGVHTLRFPMTFGRSGRSGLTDLDSDALSFRFLASACRRMHAVRLCRSQKQMLERCAAAQSSASLLR